MWYFRRSKELALFTTTTRTEDDDENSAGAQVWSVWGQRRGDYGRIHDDKGSSSCGAIVLGALRSGCGHPRMNKSHRGPL
ncbi:hypothetical protein M406DRAFT_358412 [Cryphonectria parasitica EP155]|uniref:Uncharacterized protein n=1 Tax=Cryphonectria parasitica (strain ATCC 38755 / EP155) TaxID=660469 RepID=A0A9P4XTI8_CRYP1|nr:uncharacterized protein M406DRAFT_358412 [Cryphonectria parasitica EP155]KAF3760957.1 hypothetical protein M406DRAFT_358412 [Cryphonectria parasitica EP155]